jgi:4-hydroxy-2-oxoheptanedioate aldolase
MKLGTCALMPSSLMPSSLMPSSSTRLARPIDPPDQEPPMPMPDVVARLAPSLRGQGLHVTCFLSYPDVSFVETMARGALDSVLLDMQHGMFDLAGVIAGVGAAAAAGKPAWVRVPVGDMGLASRVIDVGAAGVVCPMVNTPAEARALVQALKYPPLGARSWGPQRALAVSGLAGADYLRRANEMVMALAMIETRTAIDNLEDILTTPGIDGVFVGPSDMAVSLGGGASTRHPDVARLSAHVAARALAHGKIAGIFCSDVPAAAAAARDGFKMVSLMQDTMLVTAALSAACAQLRAQLSP